MVYPQSFCSKEQKIRDQKATQLLLDIQKADKAFKKNPMAQTESTLTALRNYLRILYLHKYDYNLAKLKWNFYLQGDRRGPRNRVKNFQTKTKIPFMYSPQKDEVVNPQIIANLFMDYYKGLYNLGDNTSTHPISVPTIENFLSRVSLPKVSKLQLDCLNKPLTLQEVKNMNKSSKKLKSPGPDGLPNEYYQTVSDVVSPYRCTVC